MRDFYLADKLPAIVLFEPADSAGLPPVLHCRGCHQVTLGGESLHQALSHAGYNVFALARPHIPATDWRGVVTPNPPVRFDAPWIMANAQLVPSNSLLDELHRLRSVGAGSQPAWWGSEHQTGVPILATLPASVPPPTAWAPAGLDGWLHAMQVRNVGNLPLTVWTHPHQFIQNLDQNLRDHLGRQIARGDVQETAPNVFVNRHFVMPSHIAFDTSGGPIVIGEGVQFGAFCSLTGPLVIGDYSRIRDHASLRGPLSIGLHCKIGGEVESSIFEDYANKGHYGYIGHSYVGSWVNLGAGTTSSNLKHTYGPISIETPMGRISTGMQFLGMIAADFSRTSIHCGIMTGKSLGIGSFSFGTISRDVPPFVNFAPQFGSVTSIDLETVLRANERMMQRRGVAMSQSTVELLSAAYERTASERVGIPLGPVRF
jgi:UDP-N-acetylglucosamine diphosphorylase / glucose-1-phosphate thymidylyltransferase / UDP-N-acetylgalactosamine diphosphorylase / glucosamine-1-phosphate N-acetyltransferase / galactosamine-1-phosphate N-acetyltransferase